jgi:hypothetical protein
LAVSVTIWLDSGAIAAITPSMSAFATPAG